MAEHHKHHLFHRHKDEDNTGEDTIASSEGNYNTDGYNSGYGKPTGEETGFPSETTDGYNNTGYGKNTGDDTGFVSENTGYGYGKSNAEDTGFGSENTGYGHGRTTGEDTGFNSESNYATGGYNSGYAKTTEDHPDYEKQEKHAKRKEHLGELGTVAAGGFALYEKHEAKKDPEHAHKHKIEEEILAAAAVGSGGYAFHEKHERKGYKEERKEEEEEEEEEGGKKHHFFG